MSDHDKSYPHITTTTNTSEKKFLEILIGIYFLVIFKTPAEFSFETTPP